MSFFSQLDDIRDLRPRLKWAMSIICVSFFILFCRLWYLQVIRGDHFFEFSLSNTIKTVPIPASRGRIFDRHGVVLADSRPAYKVLLNRQYVSNMGSIIHVLGQLLDMTADEVQSQIEKAKGQPRFWPIPIREHINHEQLAKLEVNRLFFPALETAAEPARFYPAENGTFHLLGYLGEVSQAELKNFKDDFPDTYKKGDLIGKMGIEKFMDVHLKGIDGGEQAVVDALGRRTDDALLVRDLENQKPIPGNDLVLTIDMELQMLAADLFKAKNQAGSAIIMDVNTGALLTLYSSPSLDPHMFVRVISPTEWNDIKTNVRKPLIDKSLNGQFAPGSTWKMITAAAALEMKKTNPREKIFCPGHYQFGRRAFHCWKAGGHGYVDMHRALVESCDVYFYEMGRRVGIDGLADYAKRFGFGKATGIGFNEEKNGLVPSTEWKKRARNEEWYEGETLSCAIGQGYNLVTPLQLVRGMAALVNGGHVFRPWLVHQWLKPSGTVIETFDTGEIVGELNISEETRAEIIKGFTGVVEQPGGTAYWTRLPNVTHGGKTGTAQVIQLPENKKRLRVEEMQYMHRDHGWFVSFAPAENPEIALVVLAEHGGHGGAVAAPIVRDLIARYFEKKARPAPTPGDESASVSEKKSVTTTIKRDLPPPNSDGEAPPVAPVPPTSGENPPAAVSPQQPNAQESPGEETLNLDEENG